MKRQLHITQTLVLNTDDLKYAIEAAVGQPIQSLTWTYRDELVDCQNGRHTYERVVTGVTVTLDANTIR